MMKLTVIADKKGDVLGTYRKPTQVRKDAPTFAIHGTADHVIHELDLPDEFEKIESAKELHERLKTYLSKR